jgi:S1-C subfamily serine protease
MSALSTVQPAARGVMGDASSGVAGGRVKSGTGYFVSRDGLVVTTAHVIAGCPRIAVWPERGPERTARVVASDATLDLALLTAASDVPHDDTSAHRYAVARPGDPVSTLGFGVLPSKPRQPVITDGTLIGDAADAAGNRILLIRAKLREGSSGGPVIDGKGSLLGVVRGRDTELPEVGVVTPSVEIGEFLLRHGIAPISNTPGGNPPIDRVGMLKAMAVLVQCATRAVHAPA